MLVVLFILLKTRRLGLNVLFQTKFSFAFVFLSLKHLGPTTANIPIKNILTSSDNP